MQRIHVIFAQLQCFLKMFYSIRNLGGDGVEIKIKHISPSVLHYTSFPKVRTNIVIRDSEEILLSHLIRKTSI